MTGVGDIFLNLRLRDAGFKKDMNSMHSFASSAVKKLAAAFTVKALADFGKKCIDLGSDLTEVQNVVDVAFPKMSKTIDTFANKAASQFGLSETMAKRYAGTFGSMAEAFGFSEKSAVSMSTTLTGLAGDVASFYNISQDEAYTKLKSVFTGETESLKELGVVMTQTALDQYALSHGFGKTTSAMSEAEKVALRYKFVQDQLKNATGDFARTAAGSWANQVRILSLQFDSLRAAIGQILVKALLPLVKGINAVLGRMVSLAKTWSAFFGVDTSNVVNAAGDVSSGLSDVSAGIDATGNKAADATSKAKKETDKLKKSLMGFDRINKLETPSSNTSEGNKNKTTGTGKAPEIGSLEAGGEVADKVNSKLSRLFENIVKLSKPANESLKRLREEGLAKLGNFSAGALKDFYTGFLVPVGKWAMGEGIPRFVDALNNGLTKVDFEKIRGGLKNLWDALAPFTVNVGEGLLWFWEKVLVPLGTWTANEVVPRFLDTLVSVIRIFNGVLTALKPPFSWFWDKVLTPIAKWTAGAFLKIWDGINSALKKFADWCSKNPGTVRTITGIITAFFAAWKVTQLLSFIQQTGGVVSNLKRIGTAIAGVTAKKLADKAETVILNALYAKDFVVGIGKSIAALAKQAAQFAITTGAKIADAAAQAAMTAATTIWSGVCAAATVVTQAFGAAIAFLTSPIGVVVVAITALIAIGVALHKNWATIKEFGKKVWSELSSSIKATWDGLRSKASQTWGNIKATVVNVHDNIKSKTSSAWQNVKSSCQNTWSNLKSGAGSVFGSIRDKASSAWSSISSSSSSTWGNIKSSLSGTWSNMKSSAESSFNGIRNKLSEAWTAASNVSGSSWNTISSLVMQNLGRIATKAVDAGKTIQSGFGGAFRAIVNTIKTPVNAIIGLMNGLVRGVVSGINSVLRAFNMLHIDIPSWVPGIGGKRLGFNFRMLTAPQIPMLATGAYVKANTPQLAMIGDNRHQGEFVAPEDKLKAAVREATSTSDMSRVEELLKQIIHLLTLLLDAAEKDMYLDGDKLTKKVIQRINAIRLSTGLSPV